MCSSEMLASPVNHIGQGGLSGGQLVDNLRTTVPVVSMHTELGCCLGYTTEDLIFISWPIFQRHR